MGTALSCMWSGGSNCLGSTWELSCFVYDKGV